jgi:hypothetical protein
LPHTLSNIKIVSSNKLNAKHIKNKIRSPFPIWILLFLVFHEFFRFFKENFVEIV